MSLEHTKAEIVEQFGNRLRTRVSGICVEDSSVLLIKHVSLGKHGVFWSPPGGGLSYAEGLETCIQREFEEETGLQVAVDKFLFLYEYIELPLHAVELFFQVHRTSGEIALGYDPELPTEKQIIQEIRFIPFEVLNSMDKNIIHPIFWGVRNESDLWAKSGLLKK